MTWQRRTKYGAKRKEVDGITFASQKEAIRYSELRLLEKVGRIQDLRLQPEYPLHLVKLYRNGWPITIATPAKYIADFEYTDCQSGEIVTEDVKGFRTQIYRMKKTFAELIHGITITEV